MVGGVHWDCWWQGNIEEGGDAAAMDAGGEGREKARKDQGVGILRYQPLVLYGVPDWSRTSGLSLRRGPLYPAELRELCGGHYTRSNSLLNP